ncbi:MAG: hypothetical protein MZV70_75675 [Desulfobacterales bacterium]|nr:hypothetical protein [Desulfobacterales bacterium]
MAKQLDPEQFEDVKEMMIYEVVLSEALVNLLHKKGLIKKAELLEEIKKIKAKTIEKKNSGRLSPLYRFMPKEKRIIAGVMALLGWMALASCQPGQMIIPLTP